MDSPRRNLWICLVLGIASVLALVVAYAAITDIVHGESDISNEIIALRLSLSIIFIFTIFTGITLVRILGARGK